MEEVAIKVAEVYQRARSNTRRIDKLEQSNEALTRLATSIEVMAAKQGQLTETVERLDAKVTKLEERPVKRWEVVVTTVITAAVTFVFGLLVQNLL